jgi:hypothetical protein
MIKLSSVTTLVTSALLAVVLLTACTTGGDEDHTPTVTTQGTTTVGNQDQDLTPAVATQGTTTAGNQDQDHTPAATTQGNTTVGIDADPTGNTATSLGAIDACVSVTTGQSFDIDVFVTDVRDLFGWDATFNYDGSVVHLISRNGQLFQAANPNSQVVDLSSSDSLPDTDGSYILSVVEIAKASSDSGSGVLTRLTLRAAAPGTSRVSLSGLMLRDMGGTYINDANGDRFFDSSPSEAEIHVDEPCP